MLLSRMSAVRMPFSISLDNLSCRHFSFTMREIQCTVQFFVSNFSIIELIIFCSCITQQKIIFLYTEHFKKLFNKWQILSITIALVSSVTWNGLASQHQSPSIKTLFCKSCLSCWHRVVFPTPMVRLFFQLPWCLQSYIRFSSLTPANSNLLSFQYTLFSRETYIFFVNFLEEKIAA